jgi:prepilin-type N-terminal cleavage/methylation domain-containing protein
MKNIIKKRKNFRGHTFVELMAVLAIIGIMVAVTMVSMNAANTDNKLKAAQREVASAIRMAQSNALQGKTVSENVPRYWGFKFTSNNTYIVFYNDTINGPEASDVNSGTGVESHVLNNGVALNTFTASPNSTRVIFTVPNATVTLPIASPLTLTLTFLSGSLSKTDLITSGGVVTEN